MKILKQKTLPFIFVALIFFVLGFFTHGSIKKPIISSVLPQETTKQEQTLSRSICDKVIDSEYLPVKKYEGKPAKVDFSSLPAAREYRTEITEQASDGINYAGHYTVAKWGCGTNCIGFAIIDAINGKVVYYAPHNEEGNGLTYSFDSRILIHNEKDDYSYYKGKTIDELISSKEIQFGLPREYYLLIEKSDDGYEWIDGDIWLKKICVENVLDGVYREDNKTTASEAKQELKVSKIPDTETAKWQGKTSDWLGRTFDVNNNGKEFTEKGYTFISSTGWTIPKEPYAVDKGDLVKVEMNEGNNWETYPEQKTLLNKANLLSTQRQYFYDNNYVPRSVEHFDVTGDGVAETVVTSLSLGCGRCVDFYFTIFTNEGIYTARQREGAIIKTENGNGFYLVDIDYPVEGTTLTISKYKWVESTFVQVARKEVVYTPISAISEPKPQITYYGYNTKISTSGEARFYWVDPDSGKIIDQSDPQAWFWAMPPEKVTDNDDLTAKWYRFVHENADSTFRITGTRGDDDCGYWGDWITNKCMQNIDIQSIEVVGGGHKMEF